MQYKLHVMNMSETTSKVHLFGLIGFIGTIILIVGVFLNWVTLDYNVIITKGSESVTGWTLLNDADYIIFFKGGNINDADAAVKLFNITDDALGRSANTIAKSDVKKIKDDESNEVAFRFVKVTVK